MERLSAWKVNSRSPVYPRWVLELLTSIHKRIRANKYGLPKWQLRQQFKPTVQEIDNNFRSHNYYFSHPWAKNTINKCRALIIEIFIELN